MSESTSATPLFTFKTIKNTELGATSVTLNDDGSLSFCGVIKLVTESMLVSYPRSALNTWTPNRVAVRYSREEAGRRGAKKFQSGEPLDLDGILALAH